MPPALSFKEFHRRLREPVREGELFPNFRTLGNAPTSVKNHNPSLHRVLKLLSRNLDLAEHNVEHAISLYTPTTGEEPLSNEDETALLRLCCAFPSRLRGLCIIGAPQMEQPDPELDDVPRIWRDPCIIPFPISDRERRRRTNIVWLNMLHSMKFQREEDDEDPWTTEKDRLTPIPRSLMNWGEEDLEGGMTRQIPHISKRYIKDFIYPLYQKVHAHLTDGVDVDAFVVICNALTKWQFEAFADAVELELPRQSSSMDATGWLTKIAWKIFSTLTIEVKPDEIEPNPPGGWIIDFIDERTKSENIYFIRNQEDQAAVSRKQTRASRIEPSART